MTKLLTFDDFHKYQVSVIARGVRKRNLGLFLDTGLGKTIITLTIYDQLRKRGKIKRMLVVAPKKVMYNVWRQEAVEWKHTRNYTFGIIHGDAYPGSAETSRRRGLYSEADICLINYEGLPWLAKKLFPMHGRRPLPWEMIVYDESTKIKHSTTQRFRAWKPFMGAFAYRFALTGTPMPNGIQDLFGQMYAVDLGRSLGSTVTSFRSRYLERVPAAVQYAMYRERPGARAEVVKRIRHNTIYMQKTDYLQLPPLKFNPIWVDLPDKLRSMYDEFEREFYLELGDMGIEAFNAGALAMKLRQFLQGFVYHGAGDDRQIVRIHSEKLDMLKEMVDMRKKKGRTVEGIGNVIVVYYFRYERDVLRELFPDAPAIDSRTPETEVVEIKDRWNRKELPVLLANSASLNYGMNMQHGGNHIMWYTMTWNAEHYSQLIDRLWRQRQEKTVFAHHLLFRNTIEETIFQAVTRKNANQQDVLNALKERMT